MVQEPLQYKTVLCSYGSLKFVPNGTTDFLLAFYSKWLYLASFLRRSKILPETLPTTTYLAPNWKWPHWNFTNNFWYKKTESFQNNIRQGMLVIGSDKPSIIPVRDRAEYRQTTSNRQNSITLHSSPMPVHKKWSKNFDERPLHLSTGSRWVHSQATHWACCVVPYGQVCSRTLLQHLLLNCLLHFKGRNNPHNLPFSWEDQGRHTQMAVSTVCPPECWQNQDLDFIYSTWYPSLHQKGMLLSNA